MCFSQKCTNVSQIQYGGISKPICIKRSQLTKMLVLLMFTLGNENVVLETSLNIENV